MKQTWLANMLGLSYDMVNSYLQNQQQLRLEILYKIADLLDVNTKYLLVVKKK